MAKYYRTYNSVFEYISNNTFRCIASYRKNMINTLLVNINNQALSKLYPYNSKEIALTSLKEDAYWDNAEIFDEKHRILKEEKVWDTKADYTL